MTVDHDVDVVADRIAHGLDASLGVLQGAEPFERHGLGDGHRLESGKTLRDRALGQFAKAAGIGGIGLIEIFHPAAAEVAVEPNVVADRPSPQLVTGNPVDLADDIPEGQVDTADGRPAHDAVTVPEMLAIHHLPEVFNPRGVFANQQLRDILDRPNHSAGMPLQGRLTPAVETRLVRLNLDEDPVSHPRITNKCFNFRNLHEISL